MGGERSEVAGPAGDVEASSVEVALIEPVRQRLLIIAADVLGKLDTDEIPGPLRPFARFTPAKRVRLGAVALSAALDADDGFRGRVAQVITEASPQLSEAVRTGTSTAASDPVDTAAVAYLLRPADWQQLVASATARWTAERGDVAGAIRDNELTQLRGELVALRSAQRAEVGRTRAAVTRATDDAAAEIAPLRSQLRSRAAEARTAERALEQARAEAVEAAQLATGAISSRDAELRRLRSRMAELEKAAEAGRRSARTARELDGTRLWLLVDTLTEAAASIRRELSLPTPSVRPADTVGASSGDVLRRFADDPAALDKLLALPNVHLIVDGYNVTKTGYGELALVDQRIRLVGSLAALRGRSGVEITAAFDGGDRPPSMPPTPRGVRVLFSAPDEIADDLIRRLVDAEPPGRPVIVITADQQVQRDVQRAGAWAVPSTVLLARLASA